MVRDNFTPGDNPVAGLDVGRVNLGGFRKIALARRDPDENSCIRENDGVDVACCGLYAELFSILVLGRDLTENTIPRGFGLFGLGGWGYPFGFS